MRELTVIPKLDKGDKFIPARYVNKIYSICDDPRDKTYLMYHIETGLRISDVLLTEIGHIDFEEFRTYTYDKKKDTYRWIYFPEPVKAQIKLWLLHRQKTGLKSKLLFPFGWKTAGRILKKWCFKAEFPLADKVSSHWLRHTYIRLSRAAGKDIKAVQQNTGDTVDTLLKWYSDLSIEDLQKEAKIEIH